MTDQTLAQLSNLAIYSAMAVLTLAMIADAVYLSRLVPAREAAKESARERELVTAGGATGTEAGTYLLIAPGSEATAEPGETVIRLPTDVATIVGRWAVDGEGDMPAVRELQAALTLEQTGADGTGLPQPDPRVADELSWFEKLRVWMRAFPPAQRDLAFQQQFAPLGLFDTDSPYVDPDPALPADTRLWAALQAASGGVWRGAVYDADRIIRLLDAGQRALAKD